MLNIFGRHSLLTWSNFQMRPLQSTTSESETTTASIASESASQAATLPLTHRAATQTGAIVGGTVGGIIFAVLTALIVIVLLKRSRENTALQTPFDAQDLQYDRAMRGLEVRTNQHLRRATAPRKAPFRTILGSSPPPPLPFTGEHTMEHNILASFETRPNYDMSAVSALLARLNVIAPRSRVRSHFNDEPPPPYDAYN